MEALLETVKERKTTVFLPSHVISELEDVCDYIVILVKSRVLAADDLSSFLSAHRLLIGPHNRDTNIPGVESIVSARHTKRQSSVLVRCNGELDAPEWQVIEPSLDEIVLGYLEEESELHAEEPLSAPGSSVEETR